MANELSLLDAGNNLPAHLQGVQTKAMTALLSGVGVGGNRIGLKGSRFRLVVSGNEEAVLDENYLDVIFLSAAPAVSRQYYEGTYKAGEKKAPTCYSADGIVPAEDVKNKQANKCAICPQNVKGSKMADGQAYKACGYFRRVVVMLAGDPDMRVFKLDVKSQGLFDEGNAKAKGLNAYLKALQTRGVDAGLVVTRLTFDTDSSTPKLLFTPARYVTAEEVRAVRELSDSEEVAQNALVSMATIDLSHETGGEEEAEEPAQEAVPAPAQKPATPAAPKPAVKPTAPPAKPKPAPAPVVEDIPVEEPTQAPVEVASNSELDDILSELDL